MCDVQLRYIAPIHCQCAPLTDCDNVHKIDAIFCLLHEQFDTDSITEGLYVPGQTLQSSVLGTL